MKSSLSKPNARRNLLWPGLGAAALVVGTIVAHALWLRREGIIHGVPAFFLGSLLLVLGGGAARLCRGAFARGARWLLSREAVRLCACTGAFAVSVVVLFYAVELWRGKRAWASVVQEAKRRGEPLTYDAIIAPPVPDEQDFAKAPLFAPLFARKPVGSVLHSDRQEKYLIFTERLKPPYQQWEAKELAWLDQEKTSVRAWAEYYAEKKLPDIDEPQAAKALLAAFERYAPALGQAREFSTRPYCRFPIDYERQDFLPPPHLVTVRDLISLLGQRASAALILRDGAAAFADARLGLRLVDYCRQQPAAVSSAERLRLVLTALQPVWEGLGSRCWNEPQLTDLQRQLAGLNPLADYRAAVRADALYLAALVESVIPTTPSPRPLELALEAEGQRVLNWVRWVYPVGWSLQDQAALHRYHFLSAAEVLDVTGRGLGVQRNQDARTLLASSDPFFFVFVTPMAHHLAQQAALDLPFVQTVVHQALLACALERFRLAHGKLPETLQALSPGYVDQLPHDPITGQPLKYSRTAHDHFVLYSVGWNKVDDGGTPAPREQDWQGRARPMPDLNQGDWVWAL